MRLLEKDWDKHVVQAEEVARSNGFQTLRDEILRCAAPAADDSAIDIGSGTGLLTLPLAAQTKRVWAVDISHHMGDYLAAKASSADVDNIETVVASAISLPLVDESVDLAVSNYCFHHLSNRDKLRALREVHRVLAPGGRLVFADMMFRLSLGEARDRRVISEKVRAMVARGPSGVARLAKNLGRFAVAQWEQPVRPRWWEAALTETGFCDVAVHALPHEGGIAMGRKPSP
jgi:ubiquinone/menaquinone biosynthesis C-methylase UbiE